MAFKTSAEVVVVNARMMLSREDNDCADGGTTTSETGNPGEQIGTSKFGVEPGKVKQQASFGLKVGPLNSWYLVHGAPDFRPSAAKKNDTSNKRKLEEGKILADALLLANTKATSKKLGDRKTKRRRRAWNRVAFDEDEDEDEEEENEETAEQRKLFAPKSWTSWYDFEELDKRHNIPSFSVESTNERMSPSSSSTEQHKQQEEQQAIEEQDTNSSPRAVALAKKLNKNLQKETQAMSNFEQFLKDSLVK